MVFMNKKNIWCKKKQCIPIVVICLFVMSIRGSVDALEVMMLVFTHLFFIYIPGRAFVKVTRFRFVNSLVACLCSYAAGYVLSIIIYVVMLLIGIQRFCLFPASIMCAVSMCFLYNHRGERDFIAYAEKKDYVIFIGALAAALVISVIVYVLPNRSAQVMGYQNMMGDLTYWFKNCVAATKDYPVPELSISGLNLYWHLFSCFEVAFLHFITGIEIYNLCFTFSFIWKMLLLVGGGYVLASHYLKKRRYVILVLSVTLFTSGLDKQTFVYYQDHLFRCSLAFEEGYAMSMFGLVFFDKYIEMEQKTKSAYLLTLLGFVGAVGLKVSGGTLLLAGIGTRSLLSIKKDRKRLLNITLLFSSYILVYCVISKLFIVDRNALTSSTSSHQMVFSPFDTLFRSGHYEQMYQTLKTGFLNKYIAYIVTVGIYLLQSNYAVSIPFILSILVTSIFGKGQKLFSKKSVPLLAIIICGQILFVFLSHPGFSQVYFYFNTFSFTSVFTMLLLERVSEDDATEKTLIRGITVITIFIIVSSVSYNCMHYQDIYLLTPQMYSKKELKQSTGQNDVSLYEIEGLQWVRENLPEDVVLATNKVLSGNPENSLFSRTFITSEYSERQVYLEGFSSTNLPSMEFVMNRLVELRKYYRDEEGADKVLREKGVTHAVVFKGLQDTSITPKGLPLFENDDILIIEIGG